MHDFPEELPAFVFNLEQHWFTIRCVWCLSLLWMCQGTDTTRRRFADNGNFFFNLNSFLPKPERVSNMYLGMQLQQAQQEGAFAL